MRHIYKYISHQTNVLVFPVSFMFLGDTHIKIKQKECIDECEDGSMNFGISKAAFTCCGTRLCNSRDAPGIVLSSPEVFFKVNTQITVGAAKGVFH